MKSSYINSEQNIIVKNDEKKILTFSDVSGLPRRFVVYISIEIFVRETQF